MTLSTFCRLPLAGSGLAMVLAAGAAGSAQSRALSIIATGQVLIQSDFRVHTPSAITAIAPLLKGSDVVVGDLETTIVQIGVPNENTQVTGTGLHGPPEALDALMALGFNMLSLANNHSFDMGVTGIHTTIAEANRRKLTYAGTGPTVKEATAPAYLRTAKGTIGLVAWASGGIHPEAPATETRPGVNELRVEQIMTGGIAQDLKPNDNDAQRILQSIRDAAQRADLVITVQHNHVYDPVTKDFGKMFQDLSPKRWVPPDWIKRWTHAEVDAGADVVVLHGAPVMQGVEIYRNRLIFYDLGNFMFNCPRRACTLAADTGGPPGTFENDATVFESVVAYIEFLGKNVQSVKFRPIVLHQKGREGKLPQPDAARSRPFEKPGNEHDDLWVATRGIPMPATGEKGRVILNRLAELSWPFGTWVEVTGDTAEIRLK